MSECEADGHFHSLAVMTPHRSPTSLLGLSTKHGQGREIGRFAISREQTR